MKYTILTEENMGKLSTIVNNAIGEGWFPQGGVCVMYVSHLVGRECYQAMVKHEPEDTQPKGSTFHQWEDRN